MKLFLRIHLNSLSLFFINVKLLTEMKLFAQKLACPEHNLQLKLTLAGGQCFRWKEINQNKWRGVFAGKVWTLSNDDNFLYYDVNKGNQFKDKESKKFKEKTNHTINGALPLSDADLLSQYLRLDVPLNKLYGEWSKNDPLFEKVSQNFHGVRILKQDPVENIFSFICSSNNNIIRISSMVEKLCTFYGEEIAEVDGAKYYAFPEVKTLADPAVETKLRNSGFGYRAKFIQQSAAKILEFGEKQWILNLQQLPYLEAKRELMKLSGVGAKVADCICLMSLGHLEAIPVDTHVFQIAQRYLPHLRKCKSVTDKVYNEIGDYFRSLYGTYAGWAHTILFCADLKKFQFDVISDSNSEVNVSVKSIKRCSSNDENEEKTKFKKKKRTKI